MVAVVGINDCTEATDYLMPTGILRRADVGDVVTLATAPGPVTLYPALRVAPDATIDEFDARHPEGADYVLVPAMRRDADPAVMRWLRTQASKGAIVIGVCAGAKVVAAAGVLDGRRATTHWFYLKELRKRHPAVRYVPDRRVVVDGAVATTTGISASMPLALTMIRAIAGQPRADAVAHQLGLASWDTRHDSKAFRLSRPFARTVMQNVLAPWKHERLGIALTPGMDEVTLALLADAWSRTYRSRAVTLARRPDAVRTRSGVRVYPDEVTAAWPAERTLPAQLERPPARALDEELGRIAERFGAPTANIVAMQLEYPRRWQ